MEAGGRSAPVGRRRPPPSWRARLPPPAPFPPAPPPPGHLPAARARPPSRPGSPPSRAQPRHKVGLWLGCTAPPAPPALPAGRPAGRRGRRPAPNWFEPTTPALAAPAGRTGAWGRRAGPENAPDARVRARPAPPQARPRRRRRRPQPCAWPPSCSRCCLAQAPPPGQQPTVSAGCLPAARPPHLPVAAARVCGCLHPAAPHARPPTSLPALPPTCRHAVHHVRGAERRLPVEHRQQVRRAAG